MTPLWIIVFSLYVISQANYMDLSQSSFVSVRSGENVTLNCPFGDNQRTETVIWYKQRFGEMPRKVGERLAYKSVKFSPEFKMSGLTMKMTNNGIPLTIPHIKKHHGGLYYCLKSFTLENVTLSNGTFLTVTDDRDVKVSVIQSGVLESVPPGSSVTLQCSVLSESRTEELQVLWFSAASSQSHPQIIYTHHNSRLQCESDSSTTHTCVYNFTKNIFSVNDTGTYYCAVTICGKIIFGNGTRVQMKSFETYFNPVVICLGTILVIFGILVTVQAVFLCKRKHCVKCRERIQYGAVINTETTHTQSHDSVELTYTALHFNDMKTKRGRETRGRSENSVYSEVKSSTITH